MRDAGVATTPGSGILSSVEEAYEAAESIGYPLLLKATAGGGGRGMRVVQDAGELQRAYAGATAEAEASFKDGRVYMERLIRRPRHVEVQVLGDEFGNIVHLGERDCSVQKPSHQKIIEETPAPHLSERARAALHEMALRASRHVGYTNAGTLEFLVAGDDVYFMEMNTRIQVEHPVTEMVYGIDLVKEQIRIACGRTARLRAERSALRAATRSNAGSTPKIRAITSHRQPERSRSSSFRAAPAFVSTRTSTPAQRFRRTTTR